MKHILSALRDKVRFLPRFSFLLNGAGGVVKVPDSTGAWIERDAVTAMFEPEAIDALARRAPQPIATAPEDGGEILAFKKSIGWVIVRWLDQDHPDCQLVGFHATWDHQPVEDLTHWMPLPEAPQ